MNEANELRQPHADDPLAGLVEVATDADMEETAPRPAAPRPEEVLARLEAERDYAEQVFSINKFPPYVPEEENPNILIKGRWLERGGSAWWISTAGTGKSIASVQAAYCWGAGRPFAGLVPHRAIRSWIIQSEDSPSRVVIDREDIVAELTEQMPDVDWKKVAETMVVFVKPKTGISGPQFFATIGKLLERARARGEMPDLLIINPFLAFVGGPVSDGGYVTPFLRGGKIGDDECEGLQPFLERFNVAALIYHHTPKPPSEKEIAQWLKSMFPEYQGAGSSDITNWGRSFVTMMKVPGHSRIVCMCAGKNGGEIGWEQIGGLTRRYMAWSDGVSITGGRRHAWRELNEEERVELVDSQLQQSEKDVADIAQKIADGLKADGACKVSEIEDRFRALCTRGTLRMAKMMVVNDHTRFRLSVQDILVGKNWTKYIGLCESIAQVSAKSKKLADQKMRVQEMREAYEASVRDQPAKAVAAPEEPQEKEQSNDDIFSLIAR